MTVVSDTSPINYLVLIDLPHILPALFRLIHIPQTVLDELNSERAPDAVRSFLADTPTWLVVQPSRPLDSAVAHLDAGEAAVISLAKEIGANLVLLDDAQGRRTADEVGLPVAGTLGWNPGRA